MKVRDQDQQRKRTPRKQSRCRKTKETKISLRHRSKRLGKGTCREQERAREMRTERKTSMIALEEKVEEISRKDGHGKYDRKGNDRIIPQDILADS